MSVTNDINKIDGSEYNVLGEEEIADRAVPNELAEIIETSEVLIDHSDNRQSEVHTSFCVDLQAEIENSIKSDNEEILNNSKANNIVLTLKKKRSKKK